MQGADAAVAELKLRSGNRRRRGHVQPGSAGRRTKRLRHWPNASASRCCSRAWPPRWRKPGWVRRRATGDVVFFAVGEHVVAGIVRDGAPMTGAHGRASVGRLASPSIPSSARTTGRSAASRRKSPRGIVRRLVWRIKAGDRFARAGSRGRRPHGDHRRARAERRARRRRRIDFGGARHREVPRHGRREPRGRRRSGDAGPRRHHGAPRTCCSSRCGPRSGAGCRGR